MNQRPSFHDIVMRMTKDLSDRSTCKRLSVGCTIFSLDFERMLAWGYNGNARGLPNQCDSDVPGACGCVHAEANAIVKCRDPRQARKIVFCTDLPCVMCSKLLVNLGGVEAVYYGSDYRIRDGISILERSGISVYWLEGL